MSDSLRRNCGYVHSLFNLVALILTPHTSRISFNTTPALPCQQRPCNSSTSYPVCSRRKPTPAVSSLEAHVSSTAPPAALPRTPWLLRPFWHGRAHVMPYVYRYVRQETSPEVGTTGIRSVTCEREYIVIHRKINHKWEYEATGRRRKECTECFK
ncbi:hypothetical protein PENSPDRAFT_495349 [Peniophora sp. CONT]|nr:hypothetical protein PENSPDRAFT_495349 [Peniophora sp. CONT]